MIRFNITAYIGAENKEPGPIIKCHDSGVVLAIILKTVSKTRWMQTEEDYRIPDGTTAVIRIKKPDNTVVLTDEGITIEGNAVVCSKLEQAYTAPGTCRAELSLYNPEGKRLTSATFTYEVESECVCDEDERSEDYMNVLGGKIEAVNAAAASAAESAAEAEEWAKKAAAGGGGSVDSLTADKVTFADGETFQQKYDSGELTGPAGPAGKDGAPGANGKDGAPGADGKDGAPGKDGVDGKDGEPGAPGAPGADGKDGEKGEKGEKGDPFTYEDFTPEQLASLVGPQGPQGETGPQGEPGADGQALEVYSTEETVVGTWIDGRPIYRKVIIGVIPSDAVNDKTAVVGSIGFAPHEICNMFGAINDEGLWTPIPYYKGQQYNTAFFISGSAGNIISNVGSNFAGDPFVFCVEYTKTTDAATIAIPSATALMDAYEEGVQNA